MRDEGPDYDDRVDMQLNGGPGYTLSGESANASWIGSRYSPHPSKLACQAHDSWHLLMHAFPQDLQRTLQALTVCTGDQSAAACGTSV